MKPAPRYTITPFPPVRAETIIAEMVKDIAAAAGLIVLLAAFTGFLVIIQ